MDICPVQVAETSYYSVQIGESVFDTKPPVITVYKVINKQYDVIEFESTELPIAIIKAKTLTEYLEHHAEEELNEGSAGGTLQ